MAINTDEEGKPLLLASKAIEFADKKYREFYDALDDFHGSKSALVRTINEEAEPTWIEFVLACFTFPFFPFFRLWSDPHPKHDPAQVDYYQHVYHTFKGSDVQLNAYNYVYLLYCNGTFRKAMKAFLGLVLQILLTAMISLGLFRQLDFDDEQSTAQGVYGDIADSPIDIRIIAVASSILLLFSVRDQFRVALISSRFYAWYPEIYGDYWFMFLLEAWSNMGLSLYLFYLNAIIVLVSEDATDAILNSVAIFFVAEVDEYLIPDYSSDDTIEHLFVLELFRHYCANAITGVDFSRIEDKVDDHEGTFFRKMS
jgi:hypothetical protein